MGYNVELIYAKDNTWLLVRILSSISIFEGKRPNLKNIVKHYFSIIYSCSHMPYITSINQHAHAPVQV